MSTDVSVSERHRSSFASISTWIAILISIVSLAFSIAAFRDSHKLAVAQAKAYVSFTSVTETDDPVVGLRLTNDGGGVVRLKYLKYFVDGQPLASASDAIDFAHLLGDTTLFEFDNDETLAGGEQEWLISMNTRKSTKRQLENFVDFIDRRISAEAVYCSEITGRCETQCSKVGGCR